MTFDSSTGDTDVGKCPYTILDKEHESCQGNGYIELPGNTSDLNEFMCGLWTEKATCAVNVKRHYNS